ncbi:hypothetical protein FACS189426_19260 [Bacteroidia bacterium]|nr:hypothetical protein FACS189426_19260 [Bacteroidia bacterium]
MTRIYFAIICFALNLSVLCAQNDKISFNETTHNFGTIGEESGKASCDFFVTNNSDSPLLITNISATCGCTTPKWTKEPIEPGKTGSITVTYNPLGRVAPFTKPVTVYTNQTSPIVLRIVGEVVKGKVNNVHQFSTKDYLVEFGNYLLKTKELNFDKMAPGEVKTIRLEAYNKSEKNITQQIKKLPKHIKVVFSPATIPGKTEATVDVSFNAQEFNQYGRLKDEIHIFINGVSYAFPYSVTILDDFDKWTATKRSNAGKINVNFPELNFGNFTKGNSRTIKISNSGKTKLNIRNVQSDTPAITVSKPVFSVEPGEIVELKVIVDEKKITSAVSAIISIISDDPKTPIFELTVTAKP